MLLSTLGGDKYGHNRDLYRNFSFLLTALKYYLDYMKDSLNIDVIPTRSFNYLVDDKSSYNDITFINFTKFPISVIDVEFDIKNKVNEQKRSNL